jgi:hypothetical protein
MYYSNVKRKDVHVHTKLNPHGALRSFHAGTTRFTPRKEGDLFIKPYLRESPLEKTGQSLSRVLTFESAAPRGREPQRRLRRLYAPTHGKVHAKRNRANLAYTGISYQSPWTLNPTNNPRLLKSHVVTSLAQEAKVDAEMALYALVHAMGIEMLHVDPSLERTSDVLGGMAKVWEWKGRNREVWAEKYEFYRKIVQIGQHDA